VLDRYDTTLVLKIYTAAWLPRLDETLALLKENIPGERIVLRLSRNIQSFAPGLPRRARNEREKTSSAERRLPARRDGETNLNEPCRRPALRRQSKCSHVLGH